MASTGTITLYIESVDYPSGRGYYYSNLNATWSVSNSGYLTLSEQSYNTNKPNWWICSELNTDINVYYIKWEVQFKPDGGSWQTLYSDRVAVLGPCSSYTYLTGTNVKNMMESFCNAFPGAQLTQSGELRVLCGANLAPNPDAEYPNAFPNDVYSATSQVPVHIDVSYRPGERRVSGTWSSLNRSGGKCERKVSGTWTEMKTSDGGVGTNDPPSRKTSGTWYNMRKTGAE